jgi:hypothetical protein
MEPRSAVNTVAYAAAIQCQLDAERCGNSSGKHILAGPKPLGIAGVEHHKIRLKRITPLFRHDVFPCAYFVRGWQPSLEQPLPGGFSAVPGLLRIVCCSGMQTFVVLPDLSFPGREPQVMRLRGHVGCLSPRSAGYRPSDRNQQPDQKALCSGALPTRHDPEGTIELLDVFHPCLRVHVPLSRRELRVSEEVLDEHGIRLTRDETAGSVAQAVQLDLA